MLKVGPRFVRFEISLGFVTWQTTLFPQFSRCTAGRINLFEDVSTICFNVTNIEIDSAVHNDWCGDSRPVPGRSRTG